MKRSKEEIFLEQMEKEKRKQERKLRAEEKKAEKLLKKEERSKPQPTEKDLVLRYANRVMNNQRLHGRVDGEKFEDLEDKQKKNKNLWMDSNFYFSVVFESSDQKHEFLEKIGITMEEIEEVYLSKKINIVNGVKLAKKMGIELTREISQDYNQNVDMKLLPFVLDIEQM